MPFEFTVDSFREFGQQIIDANGDQSIITSLLADMQDTVTTSVASLTTKTQEAETLSAENQRLKEANLNLYLRIGVDAQQQQGDPATPPKPMGIDEYLQTLKED